MSGRIPQLSPLAFNESYNPGESSLSFTSIYGPDTDITFNDAQDLINKKMRQGILFGVRCGAATLTIIIMWMMSKKRSTPIFIINQISLVLIVVHSGLYFKYLLSPISSLTYSLTGFQQVLSRYDIHIYGAANMFQVLLVASIEVSLVFQIRIMFTSISYKRLGYMCLSISIGLGLATVGLYFMTAVKGMIALYQGTRTNAAKYFNISTIMLSTSINFMTFILVVKLVLALRSRRFMGLRQFDSFHILLIMTFQSLLVPSILFILAYSLNEHSGTDVLTTVATLLVVLSLPLSSLWATANNNLSLEEPAESGPAPGEGFLPMNENVDTYHNGGGQTNTKFNSFSQQLTHKLSSDTLAPTMKIEKTDALDNMHHSRSTMEMDNFHHRDPHKTVDVDYNQLSTSKGISEKEFSEVHELTEVSSPLMDIYAPSTAEDETTRIFWMNENKNIGGKDHTM